MAKKDLRATRFLTAMISITLIIGISMAQANPQDVVKEFLAADLEGARCGLQPGAYKIRIAPLVMWEDEPGWDTAFVTKEAYISKIERFNDMAKVEVRYENVGILSGGLGWDVEYLGIRFTEVVNFVVVKEPSGWRIKEPVFPPHVSPKMLTSRLELFITKHRDDERAQRIRSLIEWMRELSRLEK